MSTIQSCIDVRRCSAADYRFLPRECCKDRRRRLDHAQRLDPIRQETEERLLCRPERCFDGRRRPGGASERLGRTASPSSGRSITSSHPSNKSFYVDRLSVGCSTSLRGKWVESRGKGQDKEFKVDEVSFVGESDAEVRRRFGAALHTQTRASHCSFASTNSHIRCRTRSRGYRLQ